MGILIPIITFILLSVRGINDPFVGTNATMGNVFSVIADNYIKFGYFATRFAPIVTVTNNLNGNMNYYLNHPQFLPIIMSLLYKIFGNKFWVGRLITILPAFGGLVLIYLIAKNLYNKKYAFFSAFAYSLVPSIYVFTKIINYEPLSQFFILLNSYLFILYAKKEKLSFYLLIILITIIGILTDWPMLFFALILSVFLIYIRKIFPSIILLATALITEALFLLYARAFIGSGGLFASILNRSFGSSLVSLSYWPARWISVLVFRFAIYLNPLFVVFSFLYFFKLIKKIRKKKDLELKNFIFIAIFLMGVIYIVFFPEGSFTHAFWIYYMAPFAAFSSGYYLYSYRNKKRIAVIILIILSFLYCLFVTLIKTKQNKDNIWRYQMALASSQYIDPYEKILINKNGVIDKDLLEYNFSYSISVDNNLKDLVGYSKYYYSCNISCGEAEKRLWDLIRLHDYIYISSDRAQIYIIDLASNPLKAEAKDKVYVQVTTYLRFFDNLKRWYVISRDFLNTPQI